MADTKISELGDADTLDGTETVPLVQGGVTVKSLLSAILTYVGGTLAPKASPTFTGTPAAPTASAGTNTTQIATTAFATGALATHEADTTSVHGISDTSALYRASGTDVALADGGTGASLTDPNADRMLFWDDSAGGVTWLTAGTGLTITDTTITASGSGDSTTTAAKASRPAASNDGNLFLPSDGYTIDRDTGAAWASWGPIFPFTPPPTSGWSWVNQNSAAVTEDASGIFLESTGNGSYNAALRVRTAPATPYTISTYIIPRVTMSGSQGMCGLLFRESSTGEFVAYIAAFSSTDGQTLNFYTFRFNSPTSIGTVYRNVLLAAYPHPRFLQISDTGTNLVFRHSQDGQDWVEFDSRSRTDFMASGPDQVGIFVDGSSSTLKQAMRLLHWRET